MKNTFRLSNLIPLLLVVYIIKSFFVAPSHFDLAVVLAMSASFLYKLTLDKGESSDKEELDKIIAQIKEDYNGKIEVIKEMQRVDRLSAENKISTLNLSLQRQPKGASEKTGGSYGWGDLNR